MANDPNPPDSMSPRRDVRRDVFISKSGKHVIKLELARVSSTDVSITVEGQQLQITGVIQNDEEDAAREILVCQIPSGSFDITVVVPDEFDAAAATAAYRNGILRISVPPRRPPSRPQALAMAGVRAAPKQEFVPPSVPLSLGGQDPCSDSLI
jgi:HSP20 family molecular chaperone IbpA